MTVPLRPSPTYYDYQVWYCDTGIAFTSRPESIECFKRGPGFLRSYDWAPRTPPLPPLPSHRVVSLSHCSCVSPFKLTVPSINNSIGTLCLGLSLTNKLTNKGRIGKDYLGSGTKKFRIRPIRIHGTDLRGQTPCLPCEWIQTSIFPLKMIWICYFAWLVLDSSEKPGSGSKFNGYHMNPE
jgi:hypothetical protein